MLYSRLVIKGSVGSQKDRMLKPESNYGGSGTIGQSGKNGIFFVFAAPVPDRLASEAGLSKWLLTPKRDDWENRFAKNGLIPAQGGLDLCRSMRGGGKILGENPPKLLWWVIDDP